MAIDEDELIAALNRRVRFLCRLCPLPSRPPGELAEASPSHVLGQPSSSDDPTVPAELRRLSAVFDGAELFHASYPRPDSEFGDWRSTGVRIFPVTEIMKRSAHFQAKYADHPWLRGLLVIGESSGGDLFVADPRGDEVDCTVHRLDHEYFFVGVCAPDAEVPIASSIFGFVLDVAHKPLPYLDSWRYLDETGTQHYVEFVEFVN